MALASIETTAITYMGADGRQFVTVVSTGGGLTGSETTNDEIIAFALPRNSATQVTKRTHPWHHEPPIPRTTAIFVRVPIASLDGACG